MDFRASQVALAFSCGFDAKNRMVWDKKSVVYKSARTHLLNVNNIIVITPHVTYEVANILLPFYSVYRTCQSHNQYEMNAPQVGKQWGELEEDLPQKKKALVFIQPDSVAYAKEPGGKSTAYVWWINTFPWIKYQRWHSITISANAGKISDLCLGATRNVYDIWFLSLQSPTVYINKLRLMKIKILLKYIYSCNLNEKSTYSACFIL